MLCVYRSSLDSVIANVAFDFSFKSQPKIFNPAMLLNEGYLETLREQGHH